MPEESKSANTSLESTILLVTSEQALLVLRRKIVVVGYISYRRHFVRRHDFRQTQPLLICGCLFDTSYLHVHCSDDNVLEVRLLHIR